MLDADNILVNNQTLRRMVEQKKYVISIFNTMLCHFRYAMKGKKLIFCDYKEQISCACNLNFKNFLNLGLDRPIVKTPDSKNLMNLFGENSIFSMFRKK